MKISLCVFFVTMNVNNSKGRGLFVSVISQLETLAQWMKQSNKTVVLTGAGMSTESGIPDFRSSSGLWKQVDPRTVATVEAMQNDYQLFHEFYTMRMNHLATCQPHEGHRLLANWEEKGLVHHIETQNVDGFHQAAGSKDVDELHGSIQSVRCQSCGIGAKKEQFFKKETCSACGGKLRPNVVLFGENLPEDCWMRAIQNIKQADVVIVIGTSLEVYPVNQLPSMTKGKTVYINKELSHPHHSFDLVIEGKAKEILQQLDKQLT